MIVAEEASTMKSAKYYIPCTEEEVRIVLHSLIRLRNRLIREGRYTDCVDELIAKIAAE